jgi:hypothetical protein
MPYSRSYCVHFSFTPIFRVSCHIAGQTMFVSHFPRFFQFSRLNPCSRVCISHFSRFWLFLTIFQVIQCLCLILQLLTFSRNLTGPTPCISHFYISHGFLPHSKSYSVCFIFSTIFIFLAIHQVVQCAFLIFLFLNVSRQFILNSGCVSFSTFFSFLAIFKVLQSVFLNLHVFQCFIPNSRTYTIRV